MHQGKFRRAFAVATALTAILTIGVPGPGAPDAVRAEAAAATLRPASTPPYLNGLTDHTIVVGGVTRSYRVHVPSGITQPTAVVFILHGGGGEGSGVADNPGHPLSMYRTVADAEGFIAVYPEGLPDTGAQGYPSWTDCRSDNQVASGADDVAYLATLVEEIRSAYGLGSERILMAGSSNGAQMTQAFAFNRPDLVAAVAANAGGLPLNPRPGACTTGPTEHVPILLGHGTADPQMPYEGGCVANLGGACNRGRVISAEATRDRWLAINGLTGVTPTTTTVNTNTNDAGPANRSAYSGDVPVHWWQFPGGGHMAPSQVVLVDSSQVSGVQNRDVEFAALAWDFFEQQLPTTTVSESDCGGYGGTVRSAEVEIPVTASSPLPARMWAPDTSRQTRPCPVVIILPGACSTYSTVEWSGPRLAELGYVVMAVTVNAGGSTARCHAGAVAALDAVASASNPFLPDSDVQRIGMAGWSLGGRTLVRTQEEDPRVDAIVVWDNLATSESGDAGSPACTNAPNPLRTPRVPAMGQASEFCPEFDYEVKKLGYERWRASGQPTMQVTFANSTHFWWGTDATPRQQRISTHYTAAWFDRFLKNDPAATDRLLATEVDGSPRADVLSPLFASAASLDGVDCPDLRVSCVWATPTPPAAPSGLVAVAGNAQVTLTWDEPTDMGGAPILDYLVEYAPNGGTWRTFDDGTRATTGATVTGLTNGTAYAFRVTATNAAGTGSPSGVTTAEPRSPIAPPGAPTEVTATPGDTEVTLTWDEPTDTGGAPILDYLVEYAPDGGSWTMFDDGTRATTGATVTGLTNGTAYAFRVSATNATGTGSPSVVTVPVTPLDPVLLPGQPGVPTVVPGRGELLVTVSPPTSGGLPTSYIVTARSTTSAPSTGLCTVSGAVGSCTVIGLAESGSYRVTVVASNDAGESEASPPSPTAPRSVTPGAGSPESAFDDVPEGTWYTRATSLLKDRNITTGLRGTNSFNPTGPVTRAEMAAFLWRMAGSPPAPSSCGFTDSSTIPTFALEATCWLKIQGITVVTTYRPQSTVSRAEMAAFLWRFAGQPGAPTSCGFDDGTSIPSYARTGACWLRAEDITMSNPYNSSGAVTRSQMAAFVYRTGAELGLWLRVDD